MKTIRLTAVCLLLALVLGLFSGCSLTAPDDEVIREAVIRLLPAAKEATYIIYGPGAPLDPLYEIDETWTAAHYIPVDMTYEFHTVESVKKLVRTAFSENYAEGMFEYAFNGNDVFMSRYDETGGRLTREVVKCEEFEMLTDLYPETLKVTSGTKYACEFEIEGSKDGGKTRETYTVQMVYENEKWIFDGPVY